MADLLPPRAAWRFAAEGVQTDSLPDVHGSVSVPRGGSWIRQLLAFAGPGYLISVGYMDPGNWATDIAGGAQFGMALLSVILLSNLMAVLLQALSARLGIATGRDLAQACRDSFPRPVTLVLWLACELAIIACDLAEVIGTAIALQLLFGIPLVLGAVLTALDAFFVLMMMQRGFRWLEAFVVALLLLIALCFGIEIALAQPSLHAILAGFIPRQEILTRPGMLYVAIGIIGATVMPHNLYLHSSIVQTRAFQPDEPGRRAAIRWATWDSSIALTLALFVNAGILIVAASVFHGTGHEDVAEIGQAYELLSPLLGAGFASALFGVALLASGVNSTLTATLAGQVVMEGFLRLTIPPWARRLLTRGLAIIPVVIVTYIYGEGGTAKLLVLSQVVLSMQLPFAVIPLVWFVADRRRMGVFAIRPATLGLACAVAGVILALNGKLIWDVLT